MKLDNNLKIWLKQLPCDKRTQTVTRDLHKGVSFSCICYGIKIIYPSLAIPKAGKVQV